MPKLLQRKMKKLADDLRPSSADAAKHVVVVMDGLVEFTPELLKWVLDNIVKAGYIVTLLGVMPWLNIPLSSKIWHDVWMLEFEHLSFIKERQERKNDSKYLKLQAILDLCKIYEVVPQKEVVMGYPLPSMIVERIIGLRATWVVFDSNKDLRKSRKYFAKKIPCNVMMMNDEGHVDMIKGGPLLENMGEVTPGRGEDESPVSRAPTPMLVMSQQLQRILEEEEDQVQDTDEDS